LVGSWLAPSRLFQPHLRQIGEAIGAASASEDMSRATRLVHLAFSKIGRNHEGA